MDQLKPVDHAAIATNQATIIILLVAAFILNLPLLAGVVAVFMLAGAVLGKPGFAFLYSRISRPLGLVKPDILADHPEPHRFAQGFGGIVVLLGYLALSAGWNTLGWGLTWLVTALAALNLFGGFCVGCAVYYWLNRLNVPGFVKAPPDGILPGQRPHRRES